MEVCTRQPATQTIGLPPEVFADAFPFHVVLDPQMRLTQVGRSLKRLDHRIVEGASITDFFALRRPSHPFSWDMLRTLPTINLCQLQHLEKPLLLRGQFVFPRPRVAIFLGSPWITDPAQLASLGLGFSDFAAYDPVIDLLQLVQSQRMAFQDARQMMQSLQQQREELKQAYQQLSVKEAEAHKLSLVASRTDNAVIVTNAQGRVEWVNDSFIRTTGYSQDEMRGLKLGEVLKCEDTNPETVASIREQLKHNQSFSAEVLNRTKDGRDYWVQMDVQPIYDEANRVTNYMAIGRDITVRRAKDEHLRRLTSELNTIFNLSPDGFVAFNEAGIRSYSNPAFLQMMGWTIPDVEGIDIKAFEERFTEQLDASKPPEQDENGNTILYLARPRPAVVIRAAREAKDAGGHVFGLIYYYRDITREMELDRMKSEFLSTAAHELRTPMASIHGFTELMLRREFTPAQRKDILETIFRQSSRLVQMVNELLDLARIEARGGKDFNIERQSLAPIVHATVEAIMVKNDNRQVELRISGRSPKVDVDRNKLTQALTNVLSNAYKYSPTGGQITLELRRKQHNGRKWVGISVRDHGIGMSPDQLARVCERFFRADPSGNIPGTGLGMSLVKEIVEIMGGHLEITSEVGQGTDVVLWLRQVG
ncbi:PAS domain S-box-containing protein [Chitinivorax tropicus]|uniref:PAS domain S-box-containing protein n=1 Tax=Chitinivorax tropicus TaxID=714531 RepID=A0A840ML25_9PROT|nr:ATP-binding protein [Chitinivorax tropicus]MBB5017256.1 PAS domain S-box-containing protein [Chitinivorax tropicus]